MIKILENYSLSEVATFIILLALATKGVITFGDWVSERLAKVFNKKTLKVKEAEQIENLQSKQKETENILQEIKGKIDLLIASDKDSIKSYITKEHHHFCYDKKWIDDYSLDCIERRYGHYTEEGGNSFIKELMNELRNLPKQPF